MKLPRKFRATQRSAAKQRGVVLFFALIALVVLSLAAVALIRSVDTSTLIAGNLAFKQAAATSGDSGTETAIAWLSNTYNANTSKKVTNDITHPLNITNGAQGYYPNADPTRSLTDSTAANAFQWNANDSADGGTDRSGNTIRYIIQRMCQPTGANQLLLTTSCLFSSAAVDKDGNAIPLPNDICTPPAPPAIDGCPHAGQSPEYRITSRITGPRFTVSYIQAFAY